MGISIQERVLGTTGTTESEGTEKVSKCPISRIKAALGIDKVEKVNVALSESNAKAVISSWGKDWAGALPKRTEAENERLIQAAVDATKEVQVSANQTKDTSHCPVLRGFQAKGTYATTDAKFAVSPNLPKELEVGPFVAGAQYRAIARFSNASAKQQGDAIADQRALGFRLVGPDGKIQDITLTSGAGTNHAKDAEDFVASIKAAGKVASGGLMGKVSALVGLASELGPIDALKMMRANGKAKDEGKSLAANSFFSRAPFQMGDYAVKMRLVPAEEVSPGLKGPGGSDSLTQDFAMRRRQGTIRYNLQVQGFKNSDSTSMIDHTQEWSSPWITVGTLSFAKQSAASEALARQVSAKVSNELAFTPFNQWDGEDGSVLKPLGELNMLRKRVYAESAATSGRAGASTRRCPFMAG